MTTPPKPFLKPCPFCGPMPAEPELYQDDYGYWVVGCGPCGAHSGRLPQNERWPDAREQIIAAWNRRDGISVPTCERSPKWQPIETCPRHEDVLFWRNDQGISFGQYTHCAEWVSEEEQKEAQYDEDTLWKEDVFVFTHDGVWRCEGDEKPTHWMPLPEPPTT